jgi:hypothetical protein
MATSALAQNSFPTSNAIWNESIRGVYSIYGLLGESIYNDTVRYSNLYQFSDTILSEVNIIKGIAALRTDGQKVWTLASHGDVLLYDFSVEVGDTVWHNGINQYGYITPCNNCYSVVHSTSMYNDRKLINVILHVEDSAVDEIRTWVEGVGCVFGLLMGIRYLPIMGQSIYDYDLHCFKHNDTVKYLINFPCGKCFCQQIGGIENNEVDINLIKIFPNPTKGIISIEVSENIKIKHISIYSIDGKIIQENTFCFEFNGLNISNLNAGTYIINIETNRGIFRSLINKI